MSVENRDLRCYVTQAGFNQEALDKQLGRSTDLTHLVIDGTLLPDGRSPAKLTSVQTKVRRYPLSRVEVDAQNAGMLIAEAIIPADDGGFTLNGIGVETSRGVLYAYARSTGDYKPLLESGQGSDLVVRVQFLPGNAEQITLQVDPTAVLATVDHVDRLISQTVENILADIAEKIPAFPKGSLNPTGFQPLPGGLIFQWGLGRVMSGVETQAITFPAAFPKAAFYFSMFDRDEPGHMEFYYLDAHSPGQGLTKEAAYVRTNRTGEGAGGFGFWMALGG